MVELYKNLIISFDDLQPKELTDDPVIHVIAERGEVIYIEDLVENKPHNTMLYSFYVKVKNNLNYEINHVSVHVNARAAEHDEDKVLNVGWEFYNYKSQQWHPFAKISYGKLGKGQHMRKPARMRIIRELTMGALQPFTLNLQLNPAYSVDYMEDQDFFKAPVHVKVKSEA